MRYSFISNILDCGPATLVSKHLLNEFPASQFNELVREPKARLYFKFYFVDSMNISFLDG